MIWLLSALEVATLLGLIVAAELAIAARKKSNRLAKAVVLRRIERKCTCVK